ncbi:chemotaxis-specific protein-glutamate methyltransferase CheB [Massilia niastensis]|uniref:chemotaxis-specific protein-glutamate methyltransferase CheB n=1 Tax=Massilia niastensis TaxID=544911 RepID=UPI0003812D8F|nr:chemotaxis-specific protein-glutamate methyltransferase CheB [Massilia niastensis]
MIRVLVVDDSPSVQELLVQVLGADPAIQVLGCAADGEQALEMAARLRPDAITMDLHMPHMDGYQAIRRIMQTCPAPIVVVSGCADRAEVEASFRAIEAGALVQVHRPYGPGHPEHEASARALVRTVKSMAEVRVVRRWAPESQRTPRAGGAGRGRRLVLVGASTGGPAVVRDILAQLGQEFPLPVLIVQHISAGFTQGLADWLAQASGFPVAVAAHGQLLAPGTAWLAPERSQLAVTRELRARLSLGAPEHGMRPAVSHLFRSVPAELRAASVAVLLTGMGKDGAQELKQLREDGAVTIVQDRASAAVYGMPGEALRLGAAQLVLDPVRIGKALHAIANNPGRSLALLGY